MKRPICFLLSYTLLSVVLTLASCTKKEWSYSGETSPEHWTEFEKNSNCDGQLQSPINILTKDAQVAASELQLENLHYAPTTKIHDVLNNGHSIQYDFEPGDYLMYENKKYELKQFHFHSPSEHTINGVRYPLEIHLVHQYEDNTFVVLSIMAEEGETNTTFSYLEGFLPLKKDQKKSLDKPYNINELIPAANFSFYHYQGSLTTPPCSETVNWYVMKKPIVISETQLQELQQMMPHNNYRGVQPLNGRVIKTNQ